MFYLYPLEAFKEIKAAQLKAGDRLAYGASSPNDLYGAIQVNRVVAGCGAVITSFRLPPGARITSTTKQTTISIEWDGDQPIITVEIWWEPDYPILTLK